MHPSYLDLSYCDTNLKPTLQALMVILDHGRYLALIFYSSLFYTITGYKIAIDESRVRLISLNTKHRKASMAYPRRVHFSEPTFTTAVFPVNNAEYWVLRYFEEHVRRCRFCRAPYAQLCLAGLCHARAIDSYLYYERGFIASTSNRYILLDVDTRFSAARHLLRTLQRTVPTEIAISHRPRPRR